jgi:LPXTG-site transpeptidase (sortase) family protein
MKLLERGFWILGILLLAYCVYVLVDQRIYQAKQRRELEKILRENARIPGPKPPIDRNLVGNLVIPRIGISAIVREGTNEDVLRRAVGHIEGTALPGQHGNVGVAAHRDTLFRALRNIRKNDTITFNTPWGEYYYQVESTRVVKPENVEVLKPVGYEALTLVTCYPFGYIGKAPKRFIVRARRIDVPWTIAPDS